MSPKKILVVIDDPRGGAGDGYAYLVNQGLFKGYNARFVFMSGGDGHFDRLHAALGDAGIPHVTLTAKHSESPSTYEHAIRTGKLLIETIKFLPHKAVLSLNGANLSGIPVMRLFGWLTTISYKHNSKELAAAPKTKRLLNSWFWRTGIDGVFGDCATVLKEDDPRYNGKAAQVLPLFGVDSVVSPREEDYARLPTEPFNLLSIGRLAEVKNFDKLIEAVKILNEERGFNVQLTIAGEGEQRKYLEELRKGNSEKYVRLLGHQKQEQLDVLLDKTDAYAQVSSSEGFSITTAMALTKGKRVVVCTNFLGVKDYGKNGSNMLIIPADPSKVTPREIADTLEPLIRNYARLGPKLAFGAYRTGQARFTNEIVQQYINAVREKTFNTSRRQFRKLNRQGAFMRAGPQ